MFQTLKPYAVAALVLSAGASYAQDTSAPEVNMGSTEGPAVGQVYQAETIGDWELRCLKTEDGNDPCQMYQLLTDETGQAVAEVNLFPMPEEHPAAAAATVMVPLMTLLAEGISITVDDGQTRRYPIEFCGPDGCISRMGFTAEDLAAFKAGAVAKVRIVQAEVTEGAEVTLDMSLSGFTSAFEQADPPTN